MGWAFSRLEVSFDMGIEGSCLVAPPELWEVKCRGSSFHVQDEFDGGFFGAHDHVGDSGF